jgi:hypothetical protein
MTAFAAAIDSRLVPDPEAPKLPQMRFFHRCPRRDTASQDSESVIHPARARRACTATEAAMTRSKFPFHEHLLGLGDRLGRVEAFRTGLGAIHDRMAAVEAE